jgi:hypothetical protein
MTKIFILADKAEYINKQLIALDSEKKFRVLCKSEIVKDVEYLNSHKGEFTVFIDKPADYFMGIEEYLDRFYLRDNVNAIVFDCYFNRTSVAEMQTLALFALMNENSISHIEGADTWLERGELTDSTIAFIKSKQKEQPEPEKWPEDEQSESPLESGTLLCKSYSPTPFWVAMGRVDSPKFLKKKIYKEDIYNDLHRDANGYGFLLLPLLRLGDPDQLIGIYRDAWSMGVREHHAFFLPFVYNVSFNTKKTQDEYATEMAEFYTTDELLERLGKVMTSASDRTSFSLAGGVVKGGSLSRDFGRDRALKQSLYMLSKAIRIKSGLPIKGLCKDDSGVYLLNKKGRLDVSSKFLSGKIQVI